MGRLQFLLTGVSIPVGKEGWRRDPRRALERGRGRSSVPPSCGSLQGEGIMDNDLFVSRLLHMQMEKRTKIC